MHFIVNRKTWYRGKGGWSSKLLLRDGKRCCVGFRCQAAEIPDSALLGASTVSYLGNMLNGIPQNFDDVLGRIDHRKKLPEKYSEEGDEKTVIGQIYRVNDDLTISDEVREAKLKVLFEELGDTVEFVN